MKWILAAPYMKKLNKGLWTLAQEQSKSLEFILSPAEYTHDRSRAQSNLKDWQDYRRHANDAWKKAQQYDAGIITAFPQLPVCVGIQKRFSKKTTPIVAWTFNLGALHGKHKKILARTALKSVNKFIVHSSAEIINYSQYLNLPVSRFEFIPLHKPIMPATVNENTSRPFILSMGSANRDYATLFNAIKELNYPLTVVAPPHALSGLSIPTSVTIKSNLTLPECRTLAQQARINIVPILNKNTASGQVTVLEAMMYGRPVIATDTIGTRDYIKHGETGMLTKPQSVTELKEALDTLWNNDSLRQDISANAQRYVHSELNHKNTALKLEKILNNI